LWLLVVEEEEEVKVILAVMVLVEVVRGVLELAPEYL
jgi:hypothetical protein